MSTSDKATDEAVCGLYVAHVGIPCVFQFHTFHCPAGSTQEANVSIMKRADNVLDYMCIYVVMRGRGMGYRLHVFRVYHDTIYQFY